MSGGKETGRQKMIGMMYLVLTALLAMNVSKSVLVAFETVETGLNETNKNFDAKNYMTYGVFEQEVLNDSTKAGPLQEKALRIKAAADSLCDFVDYCRGSYIHIAMKQTISRDSSNTHPLSAVEGKDNYDIPTQTLIGADVNKPDGLAVELKQRIRDYRALCLSTVESLNDSAHNYTVQLGLHTDSVYDKGHDKYLPWEISNFDHTTIAAASALLAGVKNEVKNAEGDVITTLLKPLTGDILRFDKVVAKVVAPSNYILSGQEYKADIFVAAYSSTQAPEISIGGGSAIPVEDGMGKYTVRTGATGVKTYKGVINVKQPDGTLKPYPFESEYTVAKPSFAVSPTKMNVFYIGVDNPVEISVGGASPDAVVATISPAGAGSIKYKGDGKYIVRAKKGPKCKINISIKKKEGGTTSMGSSEFRIKRIPNPTASFAGVTGDGKVTKGQLKVAAGVIAKLEDFVFDLRFPVVSWTMSMNVNGVFVDIKTKGPATTSQMKGLMAKAKSNGKVLIENVKVKAPDGSIRKISGCVIKIK